MAFRFKLLLVIVGFVAAAQAQQDTIKTEKLIIVKQYSPTVNDAFKIKQQPQETDSVKSQPQPVNYQFISVPVASTFTPAKGRASGVILPPQPLLYNSYARLGVGNFTTVLGELYSHFSIDQNKNLTIDFDHLSSQGGIDESLVDDHFYNTSLSSKLTINERLLNWSVGIDVHQNVYNWYGIQTPLTVELDPNVEQMYLNLGLNAGVEFYDSWITSAEMKFYNYSDDFNSSENFLDLIFNSSLGIGYEQDLDLQLKLNYLTTTYDDAVEVNDYTFYNLSLQPETQFNLGEVKVELGAKLVLNGDLERSETNFFIYPKLNANYNLTNLTTIFTRLDGDLTQNNFRDFSRQNPFISPNVRISPTNKMYDASLGVQQKFGKFLAVVQAAYANFDNMSLFKHNYIDPNTTVSTQPSNVFSQSNSFGVTYDDITRFKFSAALNYTPDEDIDLGLEVNYNSYDTDFEAEAWNLPELEAKVFGHYNLSEQWRFGLTAFFVGEREAFNGTVVNPISNISVTNQQTLEAFIDLNFAVEYALNKQFSVFINGNNLLSANEPRWKAYHVQGIQVLGGLSYKFNW